MRLPAPPPPAAASTDLLTALTTDVAYLGLASSLVAVSGWPLLSKKQGGLAGVDLATADATAATPRPAWVLCTLLSFLPLINFSAWLLLMVTEGSKARHWACAAVYALPFVVTAVGGPGGDALALEAAAVCAIHIQVERLALAVADARAVAAAAEAEAAEVEGAEEDGGSSAWLAAATAEELRAWDARLGARLAKGGRLRALASAAGVPRAKSGRVGEVSAGLEAAVVQAAVPLPLPGGDGGGGSGGGGGGGGSPASDDGLRARVGRGEVEGPAARLLGPVRAELIAEAQAALAKAGGRRRRRKEEGEGGGGGAGCSGQVGGGGSGGG